jgi:alpha-beta hydrolase superfamily lysophospholipase
MPESTTFTGPLRHRIQPDPPTHDPDVKKAIPSDPLMHNLVSPRLVMSIIRAGQGAMAMASTLKVPTLLQVAGRERVLADLRAWLRSQLSATEPGAAD